MKNGIRRASKWKCKKWITVERNEKKKSDIWKENAKKERT